jgi:energy-coupling factor transporter ATP-binding protein EcfA2
MPTLEISDFSCIESARMKISELTLLIGPQASGKSIISKLVYFMYEMISDQYTDEEDILDANAYQKMIGEQFKKWFPVDAWGKRKFEIVFEAGPVWLRVSRTAFNKKPSQNVKVTLSEHMIKHHEDLVKSLRQMTDPKTEANKRIRPPNYEKFWRIRQSAKRQLEKDMGKEFVNLQIFIPAGRSFFTSVGKAVAAFEYSGQLDSVTTRFGRLFASLRDRRMQFFFREGESSKEIENQRKALSEKIIGGTVKQIRDREFVESKDGRKVPFFLLSSGQQETLPLLMAMDAYNSGYHGTLFYIEEPEAHLFPVSQGVLMEYLASFVSTKNNQRMFLTTHSPYVLSKVNNLIKAGTIVSKRGKASEAQVSKIVSRISWINPSAVSAYAIIDRKLTSIIDSEGLVDAEYLDGASGEISDEFLQLLEIESAYANREM